MKYIGTISRSEWNLGAIKRILGKLDLHEYVIGEEVGNGGFRHYQFCADLGGDLESYATENSLGWHIEHAMSWDLCKKYCRKSERVHEFGDHFEFKEFIRIRDRPLNSIQTGILESLESQNDRNITVWIDRCGGKGKSTLLYLLARRGQAFPILRSGQTGRGILDFIALNYDMEPIIALDLPRKAKLTEDLCETLENIKDGLITSAKYQGSKLFTRGVKIVVFTNQWIDNKTYKALTPDRWDIHVIEEDQGGVTR